MQKHSHGHGQVLIRKSTVTNRRLFSIPNREEICINEGSFHVDIVNLRGAARRKISSTGLFEYCMFTRFYSQHFPFGLIHYLERPAYSLWASRIRKKTGENSCNWDSCLNLLVYHPVYYGCTSSHEVISQISTVVHHTKISRQWLQNIDRKFTE